MFGLLLVGLTGFLVVAVVMPLVLWTLCMETLRERATARAPRSSRLSLAHSQRDRSVVTLSSAAA